MSSLAILDLGVGNIRSVFNACSYVGTTPTVIDSSALNKKFSHVILPGVGNFGQGSLALTGDVRRYLSEHVSSGNALLGICLGMQLLFDCSQEAEGAGLGLIPGTISKLDVFDQSLQLPRLGWKQVNYNDEYSGKLALPSQRSKYYFVHSYGFVPSEVEISHLGLKNYIAFDTTDGINVTATIEYNNIYGVQFHPEKSSVFGLDLLSLFLKN